MKPDSTSYENILEVENWGSQLSTFYKIMSPVQITLESCTGLGETDQYSIQMFSPNGCWLHENSMDALFRALSSRPLHRHDYFELMLVLEGEVIQQIEEKEYPYRAGICCLVNRSIYLILPILSEIAFLKYIEQLSFLVFSNMRISIQSIIYI